jgi:methylthioribose-1-phosphate isomerase
MLPTIEWRDTEVVMIDQRKLPGEEVYVHCKTAPEVARAIKTMVIRGAPAIGVSAAMGLALGVKTSKVTARRSSPPSSTRCASSWPARARQP